MKLTATLVFLSALIGCSQAIAGGEDAVLGQLPYQAALSIGGSYNCGAVIIAERYALTALTCVCSAGKDTAWPPQLFMVSAGSVDLYNAAQRIRVEEITLSPDYNELKTGVALLRLESAFVFNSDVSALPLARENPPVGAYVDVSGWGRTKQTDTDMYRTLQVGTAIVEADRECSLVDNVIVDNDQVLCLGHGRRQGICTGDIGGPAVYLGELVGLAADMLGECGGMLPERFISIASNYDWIQKQME
ncbi:serine protease SP24D [Drosophila sulfurigaster albostrigata]|uniref:trypsin n=1 Tax=Drosophila albomicans TaxID=7291 RepID=A0A6P8WKI1_DROAB|nr:serine protease SP24D [Drosophila albomicans]XP_060662752.1 serine protease SP24D [Drosophila nasuta]XP_062141705.1 serine protease SP24D [Drosophila sulfurigaster albostrigata]